MLKTNYHTHTAYCKHAEGMVIDYVRKAIELGYEELGMSDHAPVPEDFMTEEEYVFNVAGDSMSYEQIDDYLNQIRECQGKHRNIKLYSGFETEYVSGHDEYYLGLRKRVDYLNLGLHFYESGNKIINTYSQVDYTNVMDYYNEAKKAIELGIFTIFVHPDLFMYAYKDKNGENTFDALCEEVTRKIAMLAIENDIYLEINVSGIDDSEDKSDRDSWKYPCIRFWEIIKEYPVKAIIGCDAHTPDSLGSENIEYVLQWLKETDINVSEKIGLK